MRDIKAELKCEGGRKRLMTKGREKILRSKRETRDRKRVIVERKKREIRPGR
jgi:hypothetical protein